MRTFLLSIVAIGVLVVFGTCFLLAAQTLLTTVKANSIYVERTNCVINGNILNCKY